MTRAAAFAPIERRIIASVAKACGEGLQPKSIYLTEVDRIALVQAFDARGQLLDGRCPPATIGGLDLRQKRGGGGSMLYCRHGIQRAILLHPPP